MITLEKAHHGCPHSAALIRPSCRRTEAAAPPRSKAQGRTMEVNKALTRRLRHYGKSHNG